MKKSGFSIFVLAALGVLGVAFNAYAADPYYSQQWYIQQIKADQAWNYTRGSSAVVVAVIDTGVDLDQPDLLGNIWTNADEIANDGIDNDHNGFVDDVHGWDFVGNVADPNPKLTSGYSASAVNHGTVLAGIISAMHDNGIGVRGITEDVKIMPIRALDSSGYGNSVNVAKAVDYAVAKGAHIVNLSFGGHEHSELLKTSIMNAYSRGVLVVAALGNALGGDTGSDLTNNPVYPACYDQELVDNEILGVIATDKNNNVTAFTNYGKGCADIAAPGIDIAGLAYQNLNNSNFFDLVRGGWQGSSFSSAMVSGAAALLKSANSSLKAKDLIKIITEQSGILYLNDQKYAGKAGEGFLDIKKALDSLNLTAVPTNLPPTSPIIPAPAPLPQPLASIPQIYVSRKADGNASVSVFDAQFNLAKETEIFSGNGFHGLNFQLTETNADGESEILVGAASGDAPLVRLVDSKGSIISSFLAFDAKFRGGVNVSAGDVDADGLVEIIAAPQSGLAPIVKIFDLNGKLEKQFTAFSSSFTKGLNVKAADFDGDGKAEIAVAPAKGMMPRVKIFNNTGALKKSFVPFNVNFSGGVNLGAADLDKDGKADLIFGAGSGGAPRVKAYNYKGKLLTDFMAYSQSFVGGVSVASLDWNRDSDPDIVVGAGKTGSPHVRVFSLAGALLGEFFAYDLGYTAGINIDAK